MTKIENLRKLHDDATNGPWYASSDGVVYVDVGGTTCLVADCNDNDDDCMAESDAAFIAAVHSAMPDLLRVVEAAHKVHRERFPVSERAAEASTQAYHELAVALAALDEKP